MALDLFNPSVSEKADAIIKKHFYGDWLHEKPLKLLASLYAYRGNANPKVLKALQKDIYKLSPEEGDVLCAEYSDVINVCYNKASIFDVNSRPKGSFFVPHRLLRICKEIISPEPGAKVFIPYAGIGDFALAMPQCSYDGTQINPYDWAISQILYDAFKIQGDIRLIKDADRACDIKDKVKYVFSEPPVGDGRPEFFRCISLVSTIEEKMEENGTACIIIPTPSLSSNYWKPLRSYMLDKIDGLESLVMALPPLYAPVSSVELSLIVIRKRKNPSHSITFFNALDKYFYSRRVLRSAPYSLDYYKVLEELNNPSSEYSVSICPPAITADSNFSADRFFIDKVLPALKDGERVYSLSDLIEIPAPQKPEKGLERARIILLNHLSDNYLLCDIDSLKTYRFDPKGCYQLFPGTLIVGYLGGKFKVGKTPENLSEATFIRPELVQFTIKPNAPVSKDYLLRALKSEYVKNQAHLLDSGVAITRLSKNDLLSLKIILPSKEEQDRQVFADGVKSMSEADQERVKFFSEFRKDMHMKKHAIGQTIFNLNNWLMNLSDAREECHGVIDDDAEVGGVVKIKVSDIYDNIALAMKILDRQISTLDVGYGMKPSSIPLAEFISDYIASHPYPRVHFDFNAHNTASEEVEFPVEALTIIFDNIVSNAVSHGFTDDKEHTIRFDIEVDGTNIIISISNDGKPLPADRTPNEIFIYGVSEGGKDHFGIGAYQVKNLMREFEGDAEVLSTPEDEFTVTYRLLFTKTNLLDSE